MTTKLTWEEKRPAGSMWTAEDGESGWAIIHKITCQFGIYPPTYDGQLCVTTDAEIGGVYKYEVRVMHDEVEKLKARLEEIYAKFQEANV